MPGGVLGQAAAHRILHRAGLARVLHREPDPIVGKARGLEIPDCLLGEAAVAEEPDDGAAGAIEFGHDVLLETGMDTP